MIRKRVSRNILRAIIGKKKERNISMTHDPWPMVRILETQAQLDFNSYVRQLGSRNMLYCFSPVLVARDEVWLCFCSVKSRSSSLYR